MAILAIFALLAGPKPTEQELVPLHVYDDGVIVTFADQFSYKGTIVSSGFTGDDVVHHRKNALAFGQFKLSTRFAPSVPLRRSLERCRASSSSRLSLRLRSSAAR